jgi:alpha-D-ribose 1-methylphosphonate 5-triphosphate synthase subunit PhnH
VVREAGFDEVFDSQATFRALLDAMSRPGTVRQVPRIMYESPPAGFCRPALSILKTLCDHRVSFSIGEAHTSPEWIRYLEVNLAAPHKTVEKADFVLFDGASYDSGFARVRRGSLEYPESSATALLFIARLSRDPDDSEVPVCELVIEGPGVNGSAHLSVAGLDPAYAAERERANRAFPLGVDLFFVDPEGRVAGVPRTSTVEIA